MYAFSKTKNKRWIGLIGCLVPALLTAKTPEASRDFSTNIVFTASITEGNCVAQSSYKIIEKKPLSPHQLSEIGSEYHVKTIEIEFPACLGLQKDIVGISFSSVGTDFIQGHPEYIGYLSVHGASDNAVTIRKDLVYQLQDTATKKYINVGEPILLERDKAGRLVSAKLTLKVLVKRIAFSLEPIPNKFSLGIQTQYKYK